MVAVPLLVIALLALAWSWSLRGKVTRRTAELRKQEAFIRAVLDNLPVGVAVNTVEEPVTFKYINDLFPKLYRTTREALSTPGAFWTAVYEDPQFREEIRKRVEADFASGDPARMVWPDVPITRHGQETTFITARNTPIPGDALTISSVWDVTERKRAEEELASQYRLLRVAGKTARFGGWSVELAANKCMWSDAVAEIHEMPPGYSPLVQDGIGFYAPEWRAKITQVFGACAERGIPYDEEMEILTRSGKRIWVRTMGEAVRNEQGVIVQVRGSFQDITERKLAELALRASEERLRRAILDSPFPIMLHAEDGEILQLSQSWCDLTSYSREELRSVGDWTGRAYGERQARVNAAIAATYQLEHRKHEGEFTIRTRTGQTRVWEFSSAPLGRLPDGRRLVISVAVDVTEQRAIQEGERQALARLEESRQALLSLVEDQKAIEAQVRRLNEELEQRVGDRTAQLEAANKELEAFSYSVSHDLRAPLRAINGYARILAEDHGPKLTSDGQRVLGVIRDEALRMGELIDDLLQFSRLGRQALHIAPTDMTALARDVYDKLNVQSLGRVVDFRLSALPAAAADVNLLRQVWSNLLDNALKYTRQRARAVIEVSGSIQGGEAVYSVKDNGAGFDMKYANKLFGVFQRLHTAEEFEGTGVGLATVQRLVHRHGGRVWADAALDCGATFHFALPMAAGLPPAMTGSPQSPELPRPPT
jgi:PAS domain S-box-containing protein